MRHSAVLDASTIKAKSEPSRSQTPLHRSSIVLGIAVAIALIIAAWFIGGRQGFGQIGSGGINLNLLPQIGQPAPDFVTVTGAAYPIFNFPTHILIDRDGIVRDVVLAELDAEEFVARAEAILPDDA